MEIEAVQNPLKEMLDGIQDLERINVEGYRLNETGNGTVIPKALANRNHTLLKSLKEGIEFFQKNGIVR
jgi:hypothetical protein